MKQYGNHRKIWEEANGPIPKDVFGRSYHIHHLDGDIENNDISNLLCLSAKDHYLLHKSKGDFGAAFMLLNEHLNISPEERSEIISKSNVERWKSYSDDKRKEIINKNRNSNISTWSSKELRANLSSKAKERIKNRTEAQIKQESENKSRSIKNAWNTDSFKAQRAHMSTKVVCPHCGKEGQKAAMSRYHFDRCKLYERNVAS